MRSVSKYRENEALVCVSHQENAGQNHHVRTDKKSFEKVTKLHVRRNQIREMTTVVRFRNVRLSVSYLRM